MHVFLVVAYSVESSRSPVGHLKFMVYARCMIFCMLLHGLAAREDKMEVVEPSRVQIKALKATRTAVEGPKNIAPNKRAHECVVSARASCQRGIEVTRERRKF